VFIVLLIRTEQTLVHLSCFAFNPSACRIDLQIFALQLWCPFRAHICLEFTPTCPFCHCRTTPTISQHAHGCTQESAHAAGIPGSTTTAALCAQTSRRSAHNRPSFAHVLVRHVLPRVLLKAICPLRPVAPASLMCSHLPFLRTCMYVLGCRTRSAPGA